MTDKSKYIVCLLYLFLISFVTTSAQDTPSQKATPKPQAQEMPEVIDLKPDWWNYFKVSEGDLNNQIKSFNEKLKTIPETLSEKNKKTASALVDKIILTLNSYEQTVKTPLPKISPPPPISDKYSIEDLINLHYIVEKNALNIKGVQAELSEKKAQLKANDDALLKATRKYSTSEVRSEDRLLLGLKIVALKANSELAQKSIAFLERTLDVKEKDLEHLKEELEVAKSHLVATDVDLFSYAKKVSEKEEAWDKTENILKGKQSVEAQLLSETTPEKISEQYQFAAQDADNAEIQETIAHNQYLIARLEFTLAQILNNPGSVDLESARKRSNSYLSLVSLFESRIGDWSTQADRQIKRLGQYITLETQKKDVEVKLSEIQEETLKLAQKNILLIQKLKNELNETTFLAKIVDDKIFSLIGGGKKWLQDAIDLLLHAWSKTLSSMQKKIFFIGENPVTPLNILQFIVILIITFWVSRFVLRGLTSVASRRKGIKKSLVYRITRLIHYLLLTIGVIIALSALGFDFSNLLILAGALGVGLGFGLQQIFNNFISGIIILFESQLKVGDYIELESGIRGEVREINVRNTVITDNDGIDVLIPNSEIINNKVLNWTMKIPYRRFHVPFTISYGSDKELVSKVVIEAAKKVPHTLNKIGIPEPSVRLTKLGDNGLEFELVVWVSEKYTKRTRKTMSDYLWAIETAFVKNEITVPYPQQDIHFYEGKREKPP